MEKLYSKYVFFQKSNKWFYEKKKNISIYYAGCRKSVLAFIEDNDFSNKTIKKKLSQNNNFFSAIIENNDMVICISDFCRSFPFFYYKNENSFIVSNNARILQTELQLNKLEKDSIYECFLSGYVSGKKTLYKNLFQAEVLKFLKFNKSTKKLSENYYYFYHKKIVFNIERNDALFKLDKVIDNSINRLIRRANNRTIIIFMSGGLDSRLIISKLVEKGYKKILAYSYGLPGNSDSKIASEVCKKLNVKWEHINISKRDYYDFFNQKNVINYIRFSDGLSTVPNFQDFFPLSKLKFRLKQKKNYLIVNGQSADFNTGGHMPPSLFFNNSSKKTLINEIISRHFSLWKSHRFDNKIKKKLTDKILEYELNLKKNDLSLADLYEIWEFEERQVKFIVQGQRIYDYFGFDWHLPLWDGEFTRFWSEMPLKFRKNKSLYIEYLRSWNYMSLFKEYDPKIHAFSGFPYNLFTLILILTKMIFGKKKRDNIAGYFDFYSRYGQPYHFFGLKEFLKHRRRIRNPISLYVKKWFEYLRIYEKVSFK